MSGESTGTTSVLSDSSTAAQTATGDQTTQDQQTQQQAAPSFKFPDGFDYKSIVPEDIRTDPVFAKYKDLDGVFRGLHGAQKLIGKDPSNLLEVPAPTDAAAMRAAMNRLGASEKAEDYKLEPVKGAPDWLGPDKPLGGWLAKTAHEAGIPISAMNNLYAGFVGEMTKAVAAQQAAAVDTANQAIAKMKEEWGADFDGTVRRAKLAIDKLGGAPLREALEAADLGVHPAVIQALAKAGALFEESTDGGDDKGVGSEPLPSEDKAKAIELTQRALSSDNPVERNRLQAEARKFFERAAKGKKL